MLKQSDILQAAKAKLGELYPKRKVYLEDSRAAPQMPCFFLKLIKTTTEEKADITRNDCTLFITYFAKKGGQYSLALMDVADTVAGAFCHGLRVGERFLHFGGVSSETYGKEADIVQVTLPFTYYDSVGEETKYLIEHIHHKEKNGGAAYRIQ